MSEKRKMHEIMIALTKVAARVFRNHVGLAYQGRAQRFSRPGTVEVDQGDVLIRQARTVRAGLVVGSSDLVGWQQITIGELDIGRTIAQFVACEVKDDDGVLEPEQSQFLQVVKDSGGVAIVARSAEDAVNGIKLGGNYHGSCH